MKNKMKRTVSMALVLLLCIGLLPMIVMEAKAASGLTLEELQAKYPAGKYWNHKGNPGSSNAVNNPDGYTSTPCSSHGDVGTSTQTCNGFTGGGTMQLSWQCMGFAEQLGYLATGYNPRNNANGWYTYWYSSALDNLKAGDIVRYKNDGHSIYVIGVDGDTVTYADCNSDGHCIIRWGATISKSTLRATFTNVRSAPNELVSSSNKSNPVVSSYNMVLPLKAYLMGTSTVYPYSNSQMTVSNGGEIWSSDECTITEVYSNGACKVTYPVGNSTRTAFAALSNFLVNTSGSFTKQTIDRKITTYIRPGGAEYGYIDSGDEIYTIGTSGSMTQIFYPVDAQYGGGYKLGWVETSLLNTAHTCNRNEFVFFEEAHPHYNCYRCTVCGEIYRDVTTAYSSSCRDCNIPGKPALKDMKISYLDSETVKFTWDATEHTTLYNIWLDKKNAQGEWEKYDQIAYVTSGKEVSLGLGEYRACVQSYNSEFWFEDGSDWLYTEGDFVYFAVVKSQYTVNYNLNGGTGTINSQTKTYGKHLTLSTVVPTKENDIFMGWAAEEDPTVVLYQPGDTYAADRDIVLVAVWKQNLNPAIIVDSVLAKPGETVAIPIRIAENPGIIAARLKINYNTDVLRLILASDGNILGAHQFGEDLTVSPYIVSWANGEATEDYMTNGTLVYLIFEVADDAPAGEFAITVSYDPQEIHNKDSESVSFSVQSGVITVEKTAANVPDSADEKPGGFFAAIAAFFEAIFRILFFFLYL